MKFRPDRRRRLEARVDLTALLNVVFLLLLFFLLSSTFVPRAIIPIQAVPAEGRVAYEEKDLTITLAHGEGGPEGKGPVYVNEVAVQDLDELARILTEARVERPDLKVLIRPDARIESARLIEVLSLAGRAGIQRYAIAAQPLEQPPEP